MIIPAPFWQTGTKVATPTMGYPNDGEEVEINVYPETSIALPISCATAGSHIFYTLNGSQPTHSGDTATGITARIGSNSGHITLAGSPTGIHYNVIAIGYLPSLADSDPMSQRFVITRDSGA